MIKSEMKYCLTLTFRSTQKLQRSEELQILPTGSLASLTISSKLGRSFLGLSGERKHHLQPENRSSPLWMIFRIMNSMLAFCLGHIMSLVTRLTPQMEPQQLMRTTGVMRLTCSSPLQSVLTSGTSSAMWRMASGVTLKQMPPGQEWLLRYVSRDSNTDLGHCLLYSGCLG